MAGLAVTDELGPLREVHAHLLSLLTKEVAELLEHRLFFGINQGKNGVGTTFGRDEETLMFHRPGTVLGSDDVLTRGTVGNLRGRKDTTNSLNHLGVDGDTKVLEEGVVAEAGHLTQGTNVVLTLLSIDGRSLKVQKISTRNYKIKYMCAYANDSRGLTVGELAGVLLWSVQHAHFQRQQDVAGRRANMETWEGWVLETTVAGSKVLGHGDHLLLTRVVAGGEGHDVGRPLDSIHTVDTDVALLVGGTHSETAHGFGKTTKFTGGEDRVSVKTVGRHSTDSFTTSTTLRTVKNMATFVEDLAHKLHHGHLGFVEGCVSDVDVQEWTPRITDGSRGEEASPHLFSTIKVEGRMVAGGKTVARVLPGVEQTRLAETDK